MASPSRLVHYARDEVINRAFLLQRTLVDIGTKRHFAAAQQTVALGCEADIDNTERGAEQITDTKGRGSRERRACTVSCIAPDLFEQPALVEPPGLDRSPAKFAHKLRQAPACARAPCTLWDFQHVEDYLGGNSFDAIVADFTVQPFQGQTPGIDRSGILHMSVDPLPTAHPSGEMWTNIGHPVSPDKLALAVGASGSTFGDHGMRWDNSGKNGHYAPIRWSNQS